MPVTHNYNNPSVPFRINGVTDQNAFLGDGVSVLGLAFPALTSVYNVSDRHQAGGANHIVQLTSRSFSTR